MIQYKIAALLLIIPVIVITGCKSVEEGPHLSAEMSQVLSSRRVSNWDMDTSGLNRLPSGEEAPLQSNAVEIYHLPKMPAEDAFNFTVVLNHGSGVFWIVRDGGLRSEHVVFGPGKINEPR
jgi:hypothetical protein